MKKIVLIISLMVVQFTLADAAYAKGGSSSNSSTSSSSSSARTSAVNASRGAAVSRMNTMSRMNSSSRINRAVTAQRNAARLLVKPVINARQFQGKTGRKNYYAASAGYQNNWLMYFVMVNAHHNVTAVKQRAALKKHTTDPVYTITVEHKGKDRIFAVTPDMYHKIQKGSKVKIRNGKVMLK